MRYPLRLSTNLFSKKSIVPLRYPSSGISNTELEIFPSVLVFSGTQWTVSLLLSDRSAIPLRDTISVTQKVIDLEGERGHVGAGNHFEDGFPQVFLVLCHRDINFRLGLHPNQKGK